MTKPTTVAVLIAAGVLATAAQAAPMSYAGVTQAIGTTQGDPAKTSPLLVGKDVQLTLKATGPQALVVNAQDGVFFVCDKRANGFKGGAVTTKITKYETTPNGDVSINLAQCGR